MEIRCKKGNCKHNTGCSCSAKTVEVSSNIACKSYESDKAKEDMMIQNGNIFDVSQKMTKENLKNVPLECQACDCIYNKSHKCHANGITVINCNEKKDKADCATFCEKISY